MNTAPDIRKALLAAIPSLRAFAISLCGNADKADDLVQETLVKAWSHIGSFTEGTNMPAWLFTILRNQFYSQYRRRRREVIADRPTKLHRLGIVRRNIQLNA